RHNKAFSMEVACLTEGWTSQYLIRPSYSLATSNRPTNRKVIENNWTGGFAAINRSMLREREEAGFLLQ
ncbi:hypothetical protein AAE478_009846, partial [Parahypoxylon ruwenzoriense]